MKKLLLPAALLFSTQLLAAPMSPMEGYTPTEHTKNELNYFWSRMRTDTKGKDCYKRAHIWAYNMNRNYGVKSIKAFMHYTDKFNSELDAMGGDMNWFQRKADPLLRHNKGWDYHVAPAIKVNGKTVVMDKQLNRNSGPRSLESWVEFLTERGERLLKKRQELLLDKLNDYRSKAYNSSWEGTRAKYAVKANEVKAKMDSLGITENPHQVFDIKCKKVTHMMEVDANQKTEWCLYSEAPMHYWNQVDLRMLNFGPYTSYDYGRPVTDASAYTEENFEAGRTRATYQFGEKALEWSMGEFTDRD